MLPSTLHHLVRLLERQMPGASACVLLLQDGVIRSFAPGIPKKLAEAISEANRERKLVRLLPSQALVGRWIEHAKRLTTKVTH